MSYTRTILITGGTSGIGYQAALTLACLHPTALILLASRSDPSSAATTMNNLLSQSNVHFSPLDLGDFSSIRTFVSHFTNANYPPLTNLLLNAALQFPGDEIAKTASGFEATFGISHAGHALLFHLLYPLLAPEARILITSSGTHDPEQRTGMPDAVFTSPEEIAHPSGESAGKGGRQRYTTTKLCNVLWCYTLAKRFEAINAASISSSLPYGQKRKLEVVAFDPGLVPGTGLARGASGFEKFLWMKVLTRIVPLVRLVLGNNVHSPEGAGANMAFVAIGEGEARGTSGVYFEGRKIRESSTVSYEIEKQEALWAWTVENVAGDKGERGAFDIGG